MTQLTAQGFQRSRLDERLTQLQDKMRAIFGPNINLDPDTIDGQTLGIYAEAISNIDQLAEDVYHSINPQSAVGVALGRTVQFNGIRRIEGSYSTATIRCVGTQGTVIPAGSLVKSSATGATFKTLAEATIGAAGQLDIAAQATVKGATLATTGTLTKIDTPIYGWQTATNIADAVPGRAEETDEQLRIRRKASTATPGNANVDSIYGALANLPAVLNARVTENDTAAVDANGQPPHSIYCIVNGGTDADILATIWKKKGQGVTTVGTASGVTNDSQGNPHTLKFSRPTPTNIYISIVLHTYPGWPTDGIARIKNSLVAWALANLGIGTELIYSRLYDAINATPGHSINTLHVGIAPAPVGTADIVVPFDGIAVFDTARIEVTIV